MKFKKYTSLYYRSGRSGTSKCTILRLEILIKKNRGKTKLRQEINIV